MEIVIVNFVIGFIVSFAITLLVLFRRIRTRFYSNSHKKIIIDKSVIDKGTALTLFQKYSIKKGDW